MVFNRLCDPESKLGVLRWLETVAMPGVEAEMITHQHSLCSMDALMDHQAEVDSVVAGLLRPLIDQELSVVFYDMTTIRADGLTAQEGDVCQFGMAKEGLIARGAPLEFVLAVPGRRYGEFAELLQPFHEQHCARATEEIVGELAWARSSMPPTMPG